MSPTHALPFDSAYEQIPDDKADTTRELADTMRTIAETTYADSGHGWRTVHAKSHGLLIGEFEVLPDLPPELAQGIFTRAATLPVVMRLSTNPGDVLDDKVSTPRGLAIKVIGVDGARLPGSEGDVTQDFVMINAPAFTAATPKKFLSNLKLLAKTTDKAPGAKKALSAVLRVTEAAIEKLGGESGTIKSLGGHPETHILGETFYTAVPLLYGQYFGKLSVAPVSRALTALTDARIELAGNPDGLRDAVSQFFSSNDGAWEVRVQLATDIDAMPIEDASVQWPEDASPYVTIARIRVSPQSSWSAERAKRIDDGMAFSPWYGVTAHRPLGGVMRARRMSYEMSSNFRGERNGCPMHEPKQGDTL
ncbi:Catalase [Candidatus Burkholderia verschuerenii]|uniref:Catalase n=1 Tax=Candidatus Burkholderia verschuerenii TaxID=242163 RepID=A0A0L0M9K8_9BURK|nr:catalase family protein [Candidatus Burkholderia verschuerenii]KND58970.1 Catalase [Candidatus Burkholderia verschuerenii]